MCSDIKYSYCIYTDGFVFSMLVHTCVHKVFDSRRIKDHVINHVLHYRQQVFHAITKLVLKTKKAATANAPQPKKDTTIKVGGNRGGGQKSKKCC